MSRNRQRWGDVSFADNMITITITRRGQTESREIPLAARLAEVLRNLDHSGEYVFTYKGQRILTDTKRGW